VRGWQKRFAKGGIEGLTRFEVEHPRNVGCGFRPPHPGGPGGVGAPGRPASSVTQAA